MLLTDTGTAMSLITAMDDTPFVKWDLPWTGPVSIEHGRDASVALKQTAAELLDNETLVGRQVADAHAQRVVLSSGVRFVRPTFGTGCRIPTPGADFDRPHCPSDEPLGHRDLHMDARHERGAASMRCRYDGCQPGAAGCIGVLEQLIPIAFGIGVAYVGRALVPGPRRR